MEGTSGQTYAVIVGISDYQDPQIPDLRFAHRDAEAFASYLRSPAGGSLDDNDIKVLINNQATMAQFAIALDWLWENCKENDEAIIYFSGHGDVEKKSLTQPGFLLCWDSPSKVYMAGGAFPLPMLQEVISTLSTQNKSKVIVITDACHSGKLSGSEIYGAQLTGQNLARQYGNEIKILSCQPNEVSIEGEQWGGGRGAFSYNLVNALYGLADVNNDFSVSLQEVGRYLEDHVTAEVAPVSQVPLVVGNRATPLCTVDGNLLSDIASGKTSQTQLLSPIDSRGLIEDLLADRDTAIKKLYVLFEKSLEEKNFFESTSSLHNHVNDCADAYFEQLIAEPKLTRMHSTIRRNYAAALQDEAQQTMNEWLKTDVSQTLMGGFKGRMTNLPVRIFSEKVKSFPKCLDRAANLLGKDHYMYSTLMSRKYFFEGYLLGNGNRNPNQDIGYKALDAFRQSLQWERELPVTYLQMSQVFGYQLLEPDSMELYANKAMESYPNWILPYTSLAFNFSQKYKMFDRAKPYLDQALLIDSSSAKAWNCIGVYHVWKRENNEAEYAFKRTILLDSTFADAYNNLGLVYNNSRRFDEAEEMLKKSIQLDSTNALPLNTLGFLYNNTGRYQEAEIVLKRAIGLNPIFAEAHLNLGNTYYFSERYDEAENSFSDVIHLDSTFTMAWGNLGAILKIMERYDDAEKCLLIAIRIDTTFWQARANLSIVYNKQKLWEKSADMARRALIQAPGVPTLHDILGIAYFHLPAFYDKARSSLNKAKELNENYPDTYFHLAIIEIYEGHVDEAWANIEQGFERGVGFGQITFENLNADPDYDLLRQDPRWETLLEKYQEK